MKTFSIISLGCPKNLVDSQSICDVFIRNGYKFILTPENVDTVIINTCSFIKKANIESAKVINKFIKLKKDGKIKNLYVAGCMVSRFRNDILKKYPLVDAFFDINSFFGIDRFLKNKCNRRYIPSDTLEYHSKFLLTLPHVAYLKISDGCNNFCSYCVIPFIRGSYRSRKIEDLSDEVKALADIGVREVVIISQDTLRYGIDLYGKKMILKLLERIECIDGIKWIRLMYLYPSEIDLEFVKFVSKSRKIVHYLDIPLQHVSDKILKLMNRRYDFRTIINILNIIYKYLPDACIRTNFIVGFPSETDNDFKMLLRFIEKFPINYVNLFKYSREKGSLSYNFKQIDSKVKEERYKILLNLASKKIDDMNKELVGKRFTIIADSSSRGRGYVDAPEIDGCFKTDCEMKRGFFYDVEVINAKGLIRFAKVLKGGSSEGSC